MAQDIQRVVIAWVSARRYPIEAVLTALVLLMYFLFPQSEGLVVSISALGAYYFISGYFVLALNDLLGIIASKVTGIASSVCAVGFLFRHLSLTGANQMLLIGAASLALYVLIMILFWLKSSNKDYVLLMVRGAMLSALAGWIILDAVRQHGALE